MRKESEGLLQAMKWSCKILLVDEAVSRSLCSVRKRGLVIPRPPPDHQSESKSSSTLQLPLAVNTPNTIKTLFVFSFSFLGLPAGWLAGWLAKGRKERRLSLTTVLLKELSVVGTCLSRFLEISWDFQARLAVPRDKCVIIRSQASLSPKMPIHPCIHQGK